MLAICRDGAVFARFTLLSYANHDPHRRLRCAARDAADAMLPCCCPPFDMLMPLFSILRVFDEAQRCCRAECAQRAEQARDASAKPLRRVSTPLLPPRVRSMAETCYVCCHHATLRLSSTTTVRRRCSLTPGRSATPSSCTRTTPPTTGLFKCCHVSPDSWLSCQAFEAAAGCRRRFDSFSFPSFHCR